VTFLVRVTRDLIRTARRRVWVRFLLMGWIDSLRVLGAMGRVTAPTLVDLVRNTMTRDSIDERTHWFGRRVIELLDVKLTATGAELVPPDRAYVYMSNHQSHLDIPMLYATLPSPTIRMLGKTELFQIPLWGRGLRAAEFIEVDRSNHARAVKSIEYAAHLIDDGVSIYLAPEGTRSRDGKIGPLKKGGFHLAHDTGAPIVPVAIQGTIDILPRGAKKMVSGRRVAVTIGAPIPVAGRAIADLMAEVSAFLIRHVEH
jgi:1-acyl-sn-glycerol-3-phosphate acyltransferase